MAEYQAGSVEAFNRLHDALAADLRAYLTALSRDPTRADDLLQETFLQIRPMVLGAPFMILATLMAVRAFPTRPAIAGALGGLSAGVLSDAGWRLSCWISNPAHILQSHGLAILGLAAAGSLLAVAGDVPRWRRLRSR